MLAGHLVGLVVLFMFTTPPIVALVVVVALMAPDLHRCKGVLSLSFHIGHHRFSGLLVAHVLEVELEVLLQVWSAQLNHDDCLDILWQLRVGHCLIACEDVLEFEQVLLDLLYLLGRLHVEDAL